jgi:nucleotide-binding universal stress UspA family protein
VLVGPHAVARDNADVMLVPIDDSENSAQILPAALAVADALKMRLRLVQVGDHGVPADSNESSFIRHEAMQLPEPHNRDFDVLHGDVETAISEYASQTADVGMIAMATRGIPAGARLTMGSTALSVLRHATVPMLMLHPGAED